MAQFIFVNNLNTTLSAAINSTQTTISVTSVSGFPTLNTDQILPLTLLDAATQSVYEIVYVTGISGTTLTIQRGMEGSIANTYAVGDYVSCNPTAGTVSPVRSSLPYISSQVLPSGNDIILFPGVLTADETFTLPASPAIASSVRVYGVSEAFTVTVNLPNSTGSPYILLPDGSKIYSYVLPASASQNYLDLFWDGTNWKGFNAGIMAIPNATANNQPVALSQASAGATLHNVTTSRALATTYTNSTGRLMIVMVNVTSTTSGGVTIQATVGGLTVYGCYTTPTAAGDGFGITFAVPVGETYSVVSGTYSLSQWLEIS